MDDPAQLLLQLRDIHEPAAPESGSALLLGLLILGLLALLLFGVGWLYWRSRRLNRVVRAEIQQVKSTQHMKNNTALYRLAVILRRTMYHLHGDKINQLDGEHWLRKLDTSFHTTYFTEGLGSVFGNTLYKAAQPTDSEVSQLCSDLDSLIKRASLRPQS